MGLKVGEIYVAVTANIAQAVKNFDKLAFKLFILDQTVKNTARAFSQFGIAIAAALAAAFTTASKYDRGISIAMKDMRNQFTALSIEVARVFLPALRGLADKLGHLAHWFQNLDPSVKKAIVDWSLFAIKVGVVATAFATFHGAVAGIMQLILIAGPSIAAAALPLAGIMAAIAAATILFGLFYGAWTEASEGIKKDAPTLGSKLKEALLWTGEEITVIWKKIREIILSTIAGIIDGLADLTEWLRKKMDLSPAQRKASDEEIAVLRREAEKTRNLANGTPEKNKDESLAQKLGETVAKGLDKFLKDVGLQKYVKAIHDLISGGKKGERASAPLLTLAEFDTIARKLAKDYDGWASNFKGSSNAFGGSTTRTTIAKQWGIDEPVDAIAGVGPNREIDVSDNPENAVGMVGVYRKTNKSQQQLEEEIRESAEGMKGLKGVLRVFGAEILDNAGLMGDLIKTGTKAFQESGGDPMTTVAAVVAEMLMHSRTVQVLVGGLNRFLQGIADALGSLLQGMAPAWEMILALLPLITTIFNMLGTVLQPVFEQLWMKIKMLAVAFQAIDFGLKWLWFKLLSFAKNITGGLHFSKEAAEAEVAQKNAYDALVALWNSTYDVNASMARLAETTDEVNSSLTNMPSGYKVALARFASIDPYGAPPGWGAQGGGGMPGGGVPVPGTPAPGGGATPPPGGWPVIPYAGAAPQPPALPPPSQGGITPWGGIDPTTGMPHSVPGYGTGSMSQGLMAAPPVHVYLDGQEIVQKIQSSQRQTLSRSGRTVQLASRLVGA